MPILAIKLTVKELDLLYRKTRLSLAGGRNEVNGFDCSVMLRKIEAAARRLLECRKQK